jgi:hypothetical protein
VFGKRCEDQRVLGTGVDPVIAERLRRVLAFLSISGGAALLSKPRRRVLASAGEVDEAEALAALDARIDPIEAVVHINPRALIADVGRHHRLFVQVPKGLVDPSFGDRLRRARAVIERFGLHMSGFTPSSAPPSSAPAHAVVFAPQRARRQ